jgi:hypothetical protein
MPGLVKIQQGSVLLGNSKSLKSTVLVKTCFLEFTAPVLPVVSAIYNSVFLRPFRLGFPTDNFPGYGLDSYSLKLYFKTSKQRFLLTADRVSPPAITGPHSTVQRPDSLPGGRKNLRCWGYGLVRAVMEHATPAEGFAHKTRQHWTGLRCREETELRVNVS